MSPELFQWISPAVIVGLMLYLHRVTRQDIKELRGDISDFRVRRHGWNGNLTAWIPGSGISAATWIPGSVFLPPEQEPQLSCRRMGATDFLIAEWDPGATSSLPPNGSGEELPWPRERTCFLVAEWDAACRPNGSGDFPAAEWEQRLPCRRMGAATFLPPNGSGFLAARRSFLVPPNGSNDFLVAEWERRLSCRRMGATSFLAAGWEQRLPCRRMGATSSLPPNGSNVSLPPDAGAATFLPPNGSGDFPCRRMGAAAFLPPNGTGGFLAARAGAAAFVPPTSELRPPGYTNRQSGTGDKKIALPKCALPIDSTPPDPESHGSSTPPTPAPTPTPTPRHPRCRPPPPDPAKSPGSPPSADSEE